MIVAHADHYISAVMMIGGLIWPQSASFCYYHPRTLVFSLLQGIVLFFQGQYQRRRHYVSRSLGKATEYDAPSTETISEKPTDLMTLIPALYVVYAAELYIGFDALYFASHADRVLDMGLFQMFLVGTFFIILGVGNLFTTTAVLMAKKKHASIIARLKTEKSN